MMNHTSPRKLPYSPWYLAITLLTAALTIPRLLNMPVFTDRVIAGASSLLLLGLLLTIVLPGKRPGYRMIVLVLRLHCAFWLAILGVLGIAALALIVITCMSIISVPMALTVFAGMAIAAAVMVCLCLFLTCIADCLNEIAVSARAGSWQTYAGFKCPLKVLSIVMAAVFALLTIAALLLAMPGTSPALNALFDSAVALIYNAVPSAARTLVRTAAEALKPMLDVSALSVAMLAMEALRCIAVGLMYRAYLTMSASHKAV